MAASAVPVSLAEKISRLHDLWSPRVVAELNDVQFKIVRFQGDFVWHRHDETDEAFLVLEGAMTIGFRDREVELAVGDLFVVGRGIEHITRSAGGCAALIIEPRGVVNTGEAGGELTAPNDIWI